MAVRLFRSADQHQNGAAPCGAIPQGVGKRRLYDDAILGICPALRIEREHAGTYQTGAAFDASFGLYEYPCRNGQTIRRHPEFLGQDRVRQTGHAAATGTFLRNRLNLFLEIEKRIESASPAFPALVFTAEERL